MLRIRLSRGGKKKQPHYRVVVADVQAKRDGRVVERIGHYDPLTNPSTFRIEEGRALYWLSVGAQPSDAVLHLLEKQGTMSRLKRLRAGEPIEALVAEFEGRPYAEETAEVEVEALPAVPAAAEEVIEEPAIEQIEASAVVEPVAEEPEVDEAPADAADVDEAESDEEVEEEADSDEEA